MRMDAMNGDNKPAGRNHPAKKVSPEKDAGMLREQGKGKIPSDVLGSYTGTPKDGRIPEQDADDL